MTHTRFALRSALVLMAYTLAACASESQRTEEVASDSVAVVDSSEWQADFAGFGPLRTGMSLGEIQALVGATFVLPAQVSPDQCDYAQWPALPPGLRIMFEGGRLVRVEMDSASLAAPGGVRVGDALSAVDSLYPRAERGPHKYEAGTYVTVANDSLHRLVIEVVRDTVRKWRVGRLPQVEYVEGCA